MGLWQFFWSIGDQSGYKTELPMIKRRKIDPIRGKHINHQTNWKFLPYKIDKHILDISAIYTIDRHTNCKNHPSIKDCCLNYSDYIRNKNVGIQLNDYEHKLVLDFLDKNPKTKKTIREILFEVM